MTSARLTGEAPTRSRLFPKTRSWFALDAPLELLSPLSVARVLLALAVVTWPVLALADRHPGARPWVPLGCALGGAVVWLALLGVRVLGRTSSRLVALGWTVAVALLVWSAAPGGATLVAAVFLVPMAAFSGLFFDGRTVARQLVVTAVLLTVALAGRSGWGFAVTSGVLASAALACVPATVLLVRRSSRGKDETDPDTGLPNGFGLARRLAETGVAAYAVAAVVLDGIAAAREALGYRVGTELLRRAVEDLGQVMPAGTLIGRVDGDELTVVLDAGPGADGPGAAADGLVRAIAAGRYLVDGVEVSLRAHVGVAVAGPDGGTPTELVRRASLTARRAAARGVPVLRWDGEHGAMTAEDLELLADLRVALDRGGLTLAYQPQIAPVDGRVRSVEALLRWHHPDRGPVPPGRFITLAERTGLVDRLTRWVVAEALDAQARWWADGHRVSVSVNVSAKNLADPELTGWILGQLAGRGLPTSCLTVEVTETAVADLLQARDVLGPLHASGVRISIDDFGTGFTSLAALPELPVDELKVDQGFVLRSPTSPADAAIVRTIGELAHRLGMEVVAEGVEEATTGAHLAELSFDLLQGYHYARPLAEPDLLAFLGPPPVAGTPRMTGTVPRSTSRPAAVDRAPRG